MFNKYIWETYLAGNGKAVVDFFEENLSNNFSKESIVESKKTEMV